MPRIRNIIIFVAIAALFVGIYFFYIRSSSDQAGLVSSPSASALPGTSAPLSGANPISDNAFATGDFLTLLLNVKNIKLDDSIFSDPAFISLHDSSIVLVPDGTEGRPNPFAQFGSDSSSAATSSTVSPTVPASAPSSGASSGTAPSSATTTVPPKTTVPVSPSGSPSPSAPVVN